MNKGWSKRYLVFIQRGLTLWEPGAKFPGKIRVIYQGAGCKTVTNCRRITPSILRCCLATPSRETLFLFSSPRNWMESLKGRLLPALLCTKYITHSFGVISAQAFLLRRHSFPWHRFLKFRDTPPERNRPLSWKELFREVRLHRRRNFGRAWIKSRLSFHSLDRCLRRGSLIQLYSILSQTSRKSVIRWL